jgi:hypothetical protein
MGISRSRIPVTEYQASLTSEYIPEILSLPFGCQSQHRY